MHHNLGQVLKIEEWCKRNYGDKYIWNRKLPSTESKDEEERRLGIALSILRQKLKQYEGKKIDEVEDEEDRKVLEIVRRIADEYAFGFGQLHYNLGQEMEIENWCKRNYGDKEKWDRKLPTKESKDEEEKRLGIALYTLRRKIKQYEGKKLDEVENEEDRKVLEIVRRLDEEYAFGVNQLHHNLGQVLKIEEWCKRNYGDKYIWNRKLPSTESKDEEEKRLGITLRNLRQKLKQYEGKKLDEVENEDDRKVLEIVRRIEDEYAFGLGQLHYNLGQSMEIENWCQGNYGDKEKWERKLPYVTAENEEEKRLGIALGNLRQKLKQYEEKKIEEVENEEDRKVLEIVRRLDDEYAFGEMQLHHKLGRAMEIENWCQRNYGDKEKWDRRLPSAKSKDEEEKRLGTALSNLRTKLKQYEGKKLDEVEDEEDRIVLEIVRRLDEEYNPRKTKNQMLKQAKQERDEAEENNDKAKDLEEQVYEEMEKRGKLYE